MRVLIAEDEEFNQIVLNDMLELIYDGLEIRIVDNGAKAFEMIKQGWPELVLSDVNMPVMSGDVLVQKVRSELNNCSLPVISITAFAISGDKERLIRSGFDAYISKPIDIDELKSVLDNYIL
jgi:CheY-like chemotaxis protein